MKSTFAKKNWLADIKARQCMCLTGSRRNPKKAAAVPRMP